MIVTTRNLKKLSVCAATFTVALLSAIPATAQTINAFLSGPTATDTPYVSGGGITIKKNSFEAPAFSIPTGTRTTLLTDIVAPDTNTANAPGTFGTYLFSQGRAGLVAQGDTDDKFGNTTGQFIALGSNWTSTTNSLTIDFATSVRYLGFAWDAGDANNVIDFYNGNQYIATYSTSQIISVINPSVAPPTVTASDNVTTYNKADYYGLPGSPSVNSGESYTYINFISTGGTFNRVVMSNIGQSGFEQDNHATSENQLTPLGIFVPAGNAIVIPETGSLALMLIPLAGLGQIVVRRRK